MKKIITGFLTVCMLCSTVYAQHSITPQAGSSRIVISGNVENSAEVKEVSVLILKPNKSLDDIIQGSVEDAVEYSIQTTVNRNGSFTINAPIKGESGDYTVYVDYYGNSDKTGATVKYLSEEDNKVAVDELFGATSSSMSVSVMKNRWDRLDIANSLYGKETADLPAKIFYGIKTGTPIVNPVRIDAQNYFDKACVIAGAVEGKIDEFTDEQIECVGLKDSKICEYYINANLKIKNSIKTRLSLSLSTILNDCSTDETKWAKIEQLFKDAFTESTILASVENPTGVGDVSKIIDDFHTEIGIASTTKDSSVYYKLMGKNCENYKELLEEYNEACKVTDSDSNRGGTSSVRGGKSLAINSIVGDYSVDIPTNVAEQIETFNDIDNVPWAIEAISDLSRRNVVSGMGDGSFNPNDSVTREQFVKMIVNAFDIKTTNQGINFDDVGEDDWYYDVVKIAYENGIIHGKGSTFGVGEYLTREDMAVVIFNTLNKLSISMNMEQATRFNDYAEIADYAKESVIFLKDAGVLKGSGDNNFNPKNITTRAEAAVVIYYLLKSN